jgi:hypothetical protein
LAMFSALNTIRFSVQMILGSLHHFKQSSEALPVKKMLDKKA